MTSMIRNTATEFGSFSKVMHWLMAVIIFTLIIFGIYMADLPRVTNEEEMLVFQLYGIHKSFGVIVMLLVFLRFVWMKTISPNPPLPAVFVGKERMIVEVTKILLYLMMVVLPLSGFLMSNANGHPITLFGLFELPVVISANKALHSFLHAIHMLGGWLMFLVISMHMAGVLKHHLEDEGTEKDVLQRML